MFITLKDAATLHRVNPSAAHAWRRKGLQTRKIGGKWVTTVEWVENYLQAHPLRNLPEEEEDLVPFHEIAKELGCSSEGVRQTYKRAIYKLQTLLKV